MSGIARPGHGSVTVDGGPASSQTSQSSVPSGPQVQLLEQPPAGDALPHDSPGEQAAPWIQPTGALHVVLHWRCPVPSHMQDVSHPGFPFAPDEPLPQPLPGLQVAP
jgi:hypothetical protein